MKEKPSPPSQSPKNDQLDQLVKTCSVTHTWLQAQAVRAVDTSLVIRNWLFGYYIVEFEIGRDSRSELYGKQLLNRLSEQLKNSGIKGVSTTNLRYCRLFYENYLEMCQPVADESSGPQSIEKQSDNNKSSIPAWLKKMCQPVAGESFVTPPFDPEFTQTLASKLLLGWSHYVALLSIKNPEEHRFYEIEALKNQWGKRELERQIHSGLYQRLSLSRSQEEVKRLSKEGQIIEKPQDVIKDPYILEFTGLEQHHAYSENDLEMALIDKIEHFLLELGKGFLFEARQKRFTFDNRHFFVDLVFYNRLLRSYVLIDLKVGDLKHQDLGQMQMYVNYFDRHVKNKEERPTIGILLCLSKSDDMVQLTLPDNANIFASEYQLYLPSKEELQKKIEEAQREWDMEHHRELNNDE